VLPIKEGLCSYMAAIEAFDSLFRQVLVCIVPQLKFLLYTVCTVVCNCRLRFSLSLSPMASTASLQASAIDCAFLYVAKQSSTESTLARSFSLFVYIISPILDTRRPATLIIVQICICIYMVPVLCADVAAFKSSR
jgi:hypothetical protein